MIRNPNEIQEGAKKIRMLIAGYPGICLLYTSIFEFQISTSVQYEHPAGALLSMPVSYTHLDVYKRQIQQCVELKASFLAYE